MKKFIFTILSVSVFFIGLGGLVERAGARFKSDEKALAIIARARQAIGGDAAINSVHSLTMKATTTQTLNFDGAPRTEQGEMEIALQLPNKFFKTVKIGHGDDTNVNFTKQIDKVIVISKDGERPEGLPEIPEGGQRMTIKTKDGQNQVIVKTDGPENGSGPDEKQIRKFIVKHDGEADAAHFRQNDLLRTTFSLLLSAPEGTDVSYTYEGENNVDGNACDIVLARSGESSFKLYIDQSSHLPLMMSYQGAAPMVIKLDGAAIKAGAEPNGKTFTVTTDGQTAAAPGDKTFRVFTRPAGTPDAVSEFQVKFSDYRSAGGIQLPYKWTQTIDGKSDQNVDVTSYEINPANIEEKFQQPAQKVMIRMKKPE